MINALIKNTAFLTYGFVLFYNGSIISDYMGTKRIRIWNGSDINEMISLFTTLSEKNENTYFILYKWDGVFFRHGRKDSILYQYNNSFFDIFKKEHKMNKVPDLAGTASFKIYSPAINYDSFKHLQNDSHYDFSSLCLLPSPYSKDYKQRLVIHSCENWKSKMSKVVWAGETTGLTDTFKGTRQIIHDVCKQNNQLFDFYFTKSVMKDHPFTITPRVPESQQRGYKVILCIDGWAWPGNLSWALYSGCLLVIVSDFTIGLTKDLQAWKHYVPASTDGSDLVKNVNWIFQNMDQAEDIVKNLNELVNAFSRCKLT